MRKVNPWNMLYWTPLGIVFALIALGVLTGAGAILYYNWNEPWLWVMIGIVLLLIFVNYLYDTVWPGIKSRADAWDKAHGIVRDKDGNIVEPKDEDLFNRRNHAS